MTADRQHGLSATAPDAAGIAVDAITLDALAQKVKPSEPGLGGMALRIVRIVARDATAKTCSIVFAEEDVVDTAKWMAGVKVLPTTVPIVGQWGYAWQNRTDFILAGMISSPLPKAKLRGTASGQTPGSIGVPEIVQTNTGVYDTDFDGVNSMLDVVNDRVYFRWPGYYTYGMSTAWGPASNGRRIIELVLNGGDAILREDNESATSGAASAASARFFNTGDYIQMYITSTGALAIFGSGIEAQYSQMWASYTP